MAVTMFSGGYALATASDTIAGTVVVGGITLLVGATGGITTITVDGATGQAIYSGVPVTNDTTIINYATPWKAVNLTVPTLGTNVTVLVHVVP